MGIIVDERTRNLGLPLPYVKNDQVDDVERLRASFELVDGAYGELRLKTADVQLAAAGALATAEQGVAEAQAAAQAAREAGEKAETGLQSLESRVQGQIEEALNQSTVRAYTYADRGCLRAVSDAQQGDVAVVRGLGLFDFVPACDEPDDDESAFVAPGGVWLLQAVSLDLAYGYIGMEFTRQSWFDYADITPTIASLAAGATATVRSDGHVGVEGGEKMLVVPPADAEAHILARAYSDYWRRISLMFTNVSTNALSVSQQSWRVYILHSGEDNA